MAVSREVAQCYCSAVGVSEPVLEVLSAKSLFPSDLMTELGPVMNHPLALFVITR